VPTPCIECGSEYDRKPRAKVGSCSERCKASRIVRLKKEAYDRDKESGKLQVRLDSVKARRVPKAYEVTCTECGKVFTAKMSNREFCDQSCSNRGFARRRREDPDRWARFKAQRNINSRQRINRIRHIIKVDVVHVDVLGDRDDWTCALCGESVDRELKYPDPQSKSVDHTLPISKGGEHSYANTKVAHLLCNTSAGAKGKQCPEEG
jgi:5-methylcytosine-specific restriction endonuclease McrA